MKGPRCKRKQGKRLLGQHAHDFYLYHWLVNEKLKEHYEQLCAPVCVTANGKRIVGGDANKSEI